MLEIFHGALIVAKRSKMSGLYILSGSTVVDYVSLASKDFHEKISYGI